MTPQENAKRDLMRMSMAVAGVAAISAVALILAPVKASSTSPEPGNKAPGFTGLTSNGETISLDQFAGKKVILEWTNDGCPYVQKYYDSGKMQETQKIASADEDSVWITVISSAPGKQGHVDASQANTLTDERGAAPDHVILDPEGIVGRAYSAKTTPHMFVIDETGTVQYNGAIDDRPSARPSSLEGATNYALAALNAVNAGKKPDPARTKPYGCSVKYDS